MTFWLDRFMEENSIKSVYQLSQLTGISESTFNSIRRSSTPPIKVKYGTIKSLAECVGIDMNKMDELLETYETESMKDD